MDIQTQRLLVTLLGSVVGGGVGAALGSGLSRLCPEHRRREMTAHVMASLSVLGASVGPRLFAALLH